MESYLGLATDEGITDDEIEAIKPIVMAVSAGKISAQLNEVRSKAKARLSAAMASTPST